MRFHRQLYTEKLEKFISIKEGKTMISSLNRVISGIVVNRGKPILHKRGPFKLQGDFWTIQDHKLSLTVVFLFHGFYLGPTPVTNLFGA